MALAGISDAVLCYILGFLYQQKHPPQNHGLGIQDQIVRANVGPGRPGIFAEKLEQLKIRNCQMNLIYICM